MTAHVPEVMRMYSCYRIISKELSKIALPIFDDVVVDISHW